MKTTKKARRTAKGTPVRVNRRHHGLRDSTGYISAAKTFRYRGHTYFSVRLTGGRGAGMTVRLLASEFDVRA